MTSNMAKLKKKTRKNPNAYYQHLFKRNIDYIHILEAHVLQIHHSTHHIGIIGIKGVIADRSPYAVNLYFNTPAVWSRSIHKSYIGDVENVSC